jgi:hypothetical protein
MVCMAVGAVGAVVAVVAGGTGCGKAVAPGSAYSAASPSSSAAMTSSVNPLALLTGPQIAVKTFNDLKTATSVHVAGSFVDSGQTYLMNLTIGRRGCTGQLGVKGQGTVVILQIAKTLWLKPDKRFWQANGMSDPRALRVLAGKYVKTTNHSAISAFSGAASGVVKGKTVTISGQPALRIMDVTDSDSIYVSVSAKPELLRLDGGNQARLDFTNYDAPMRLVPPPLSQTIDGAKYGF